jgi:hypothetical protein
MRNLLLMRMTVISIFLISEAGCIKGCSLTTMEKAHNTALAKQRIFIENVSQRCKIFWIIKAVY